MQRFIEVVCCLLEMVGLRQAKGDLAQSVCDENPVLLGSGGQIVRRLQPLCVIVTLLQDGRALGRSFRRRLAPREQTRRREKRQIGEQNQPSLVKSRHRSASPFYLWGKVCQE